MAIYSNLSSESRDNVTQSDKYTDYINEHISNVMKAFNMYGKELCNRLNLDEESIRFQCSLHDRSKYDTNEFIGYRIRFYPTEEEKNNRKEEAKNLFDLGWLHHIHNNPHHPEYWVIAENDKEMKILDMPNCYIAEMLLDWAAMGIKFGDTAYSYYKGLSPEKQKPFSPKTKEIVESVIDIFK